MLYYLGERFLKHLLAELEAKVQQDCELDCSAISVINVLNFSKGIPPSGKCDVLDDQCCDPGTYQCNYGGGFTGYICKTPY